MSNIIFFILNCNLNIFTCSIVYKLFRNPNYKFNFYFKPKDTIFSIAHRHQLLESKLPMNKRKSSMSKQFTSKAINRSYSLLASFDLYFLFTKKIKRNRCDKNIRSAKDKFVLQVLIALPKSYKIYLRANTMK